MNGGRRTRTVAVALAAAVAVVGWWAPPAAAQQDTDTITSGNDATDREILDQAPARAALNSDVERCEQLAADSPPDADRSDIEALEQWARCAEMLQDFGFSDDIVEDAWFGSAARTAEGFAISAYTMYYDEGGFWGVARKMQGAQMNWVWSLGVTSLRLGTWAFDWAANSRITDLVASIPAAVRDEIDSTGLVERLLMPLAVIVVFATAAFAFLRRRTAKAASTLLWFGAVLVVTTLLLANPDGWHRFVLDFRQTLGSVAGVPADTAGGVGPQDDVDAASAVAPLLSAAVHDPWEQLNWGGAVPAGECEARAAEVLTRRPSSTSDWPREHMAECPPGAQRHSHNPTMIRMMGTFIVAGGQLMLGLIILSIAMIALGSEISLAVAFSALPVVAVIAMFPGGRRVASWWGATTAYGAVGLVVSLMLLNIIRVVLTSVMVAMSREQVPMIARFMVWFIVVAVLVWRRKDIKGLTKTLSAKLGGGGGTSPAAIGAAGAVGAVGGAAAMSQFAGGSGGMSMAGMSARSARNAGSTMLDRTAQLAAARNPDGRAAKVLGSTKSAGGAGLAMGSALATAQALGGNRNAARTAALRGPVSEDVTQTYAQGSHAKRMVAARSQSTTAKQIVGLAGTGDKRLMASLAEHPNTPVAMRSDMARGMSAGQIATRAELGDYGPYVPLHPDRPRVAAGPTTNGSGSGSGSGAAAAAAGSDGAAVPPSGEASAGAQRRAAQHDGGADGDPGNAAAPLPLSDSGGRAEQSKASDSQEPTSGGSPPQPPPGDSQSAPPTQPPAAPTAPSSDSGGSHRGGSTGTAAGKTQPPPGGSHSAPPTPSPAGDPPPQPASAPPQNPTGGTRPQQPPDSAPPPADQSARGSNRPAPRSAPHTSDGPGEED